MRIQHIHRNEFAKPAPGLRRRWLEDAIARLLELPDHPRSRILAAMEDGRIRAVLGLELSRDAEDRLENATIRVIEIDPDHFDRGIGSRLVRVAEDIAHINGCDRVCAAPGLEHWNAGRCRLTCSRYALGRRIFQNADQHARHSRA